MTRGGCLGHESCCARDQDTTPQSELAAACAFGTTWYPPEFQALRVYFLKSGPP